MLDNARDIPVKFELAKIQKVVIRVEIYEYVVAATLVRFRRRGSERGRGKQINETQQKRRAEIGRYAFYDILFTFTRTCGRG